MTSPEEEQRKKSAEDQAKEPEKPAAPNDAFSFVGQLIGDAKNLAVDAVAGQHSGDKVLSGITPQLAAQYQHGKEVQARIDSGALKQSQLSESDKKSVEAFNNVRKSISNVPLYDRDSLMRYVEKGIEHKAKSAPPEVKPASPTVKATQSETHRPATVATDKVVPKDTHKPAPKEINRPVAQEPSKPSAAKDAPAKPPVGKAPDQPASKTAAASADVVEPKKASGSTQSIHQTNRDVQGPAASLNTFDAKIGSVKPPQIAQSQERGVVQSVDGKTTPPSTQSGSREIKQEVEKQSHPSFTGSARSAEQGFAQRSSSAEQQSVRGESPTSKPTVSQSSASSAFERRTSGSTKNEDMRSVLEERVSLASNQAARIQSTDLSQNKAIGNTESLASKQTSYPEQLAKAQSITEPSPIKTLGPAERADVLAVSPPLQQRITLAEVRSTLNTQQVQQIIRDSEERFPTGLRWQNTFTRQDVATSQSVSKPNAANRSETTTNATSSHSTRQTDASPPSAAPTNRTADVAHKNPTAPSQGAAEIPSAVPKPQQPGSIQPGTLQPGAIRPDALQPGNQQPGRVQSENIRPNANPTGAMAELTQGSAERQPGVSRPIQPPTPGTNPQTIQDYKGGIVGEAQDGIVPGTKGMISADARMLTFRGRIEDRYITGAEIALAAIIAAAGAKRVRFDELQPPGKDTAARIPLVQSIEAYLPNRSAVQNILTGKPGDEEKQDSSAKRDAAADDLPGTLRYLQTHKYNRPSVLIGPGDTLVSIAEREFDDAIYGWLIADINLTNVKETYVDGKRVIEVRSRQTIELPTPEDRKTFLQYRKEEFKPENLITIVIETQIDRELLDEQFGVFVDGGVSGSSKGVPSGGIAASSNTAAASMFQRTTAGADGSLVLPSLALETGHILRIATNQLKMLTRRAFETGRGPFFNLRDLLKREKIKRRF